MSGFYRGKSVLITGASSGIGAAVAEEMAKQGARVALGARRADRLEEMVAKIKKSGGDALAVPCDVRDRASLDAAAAMTAELFGGIDIVIANAGFSVAGSFQALETDDFRRLFETNVFGVIDTVYATLPYVLRSKGQLALVSSVLGRMGMASTTPYCASKFAVYGLAEALYFELAPLGVGVSCICPGIVASEIRMVDNTGILDPAKKDPAPAWIIVPTDTAAREIVRRLPSRRLDIVVTGHGKAMVWFSRHFGRSFHALGRYMAGKKVDPLEKGERTP